MSDLPFSHMVLVKDVPPAGKHINISASEDERAALAAFLGLPAIAKLAASFRLRPWGRSGLAVEGDLAAEVTQTCVVSLDDLPVSVREEISEKFIEQDPRAKEPEDSVGGEHEADLDSPELIVNGRVDLGALAAEYLALSLDPYPRKAGLEEMNEAVIEESEPEGVRKAFAGLDELLAGATKKKK